MTQPMAWGHRLAASCVGLVLLGELALRFMGVTDFPLYLTDEVIGYMPAPEQSGVFLNKNHWRVNERGMGSVAWRPKGQQDLLLLGDSLVWGGNPLDQPDKLGPRLQNIVGVEWQVWSAAAGSWSVLNELAYLDRYPDVQRETDVLVWVLNTGDLAASRSLWSSDETHPRKRPVSALLYAMGKYVAPHLGKGITPASAAPQASESVSAVTTDLLKARLTELAASKRILMVLYPDQTELASETPHYLAFRSALKQAMGSCCVLLELRQRKEWTTDLYRDNIHPTAQGNEVFANLIHGALSAF